CQIANFMENIYVFVTVYAGPGPSFGRTRSATEIHKILIIQTVDQKRGWDYLRFGPKFIIGTMGLLSKTGSVSK
ncbi:hypothetical protein BpHYR1_021124, partial [Brachionus plicatilis]